MGSGLLTLCDGGVEPFQRDLGEHRRRQQWFRHEVGTGFGQLVVEVPRREQV